MTELRSTATPGAGWQYQDGAGWQLRTAVAALVAGLAIALTPATAVASTDPFGPTGSGWRNGDVCMKWGWKKYQRVNGRWVYKGFAWAYYRTCPF